MIVRYGDEGTLLSGNSIDDKEMTSFYRDNFFRDFSGKDGNEFSSRRRDFWNKHGADTHVRKMKESLYISGHMAGNINIALVKEYDKEINNVMERYIMANPDIRELYSSDKIFGFRDSYLDKDLELITRHGYELNNEYGRVMNGTVKDDGSVSYYNVDDEIEVEELDVLDKLSVLKTWDYMTYHIDCGIDPTRGF